MINMNEEFEKLFSTLSEKDQKEVANLIRFKNEVKYHDKQFEELLNQYIELSREHDKLQNNWNELKKFVEKDIKRWEDEEKKWIEQGFMKFGGEANNKIIFKKVLNKMQEMEGNNES